VKNENKKQYNALVDEGNRTIEYKADMFIESIQVIKQMQSEIKGLQTENKRILDHLFGESKD